MPNSYDIEQRALEKLGTFRLEADHARALRVGANVLRLPEALWELKLATSVKTSGGVPANLNAK